MIQQLIPDQLLNNQIKHTNLLDYDEKSLYKTNGFPDEPEGIN